MIGPGQGTAFGVGRAKPGVVEHVSRQDALLQLQNGRRPGIAEHDGPMAIEAQHPAGQGVHEQGGKFALPGQGRLGPKPAEGAPQALGHEQGQLGLVVVKDNVWLLGIGRFVMHFQSSLGLGRAGQGNAQAVGARAKAGRLEGGSVDQQPGVSRIGTAHGRRQQGDDVFIEAASRLAEPLDHGVNLGKTVQSAYSAGKSSGGFGQGRLLAGGAPAHAYGGDEAKAWRDVWSAGHGVSGIRDIPPVADLVARLAREYTQACALPPSPALRP